MLRYRPVPFQKLRQQVFHLQRDLSVLIGQGLRGKFLFCGHRDRAGNSRLGWVLSASAHARERAGRAAGA